MFPDIGQRQEYRRFHEKARIDKRGNSRQKPVPALVDCGRALIIVDVYLKLCGRLNDPVFFGECRYLTVLLAVQLHRTGKQAVQQIENTCCVPIDQCCCHAHDRFCCPSNLRHGVTLAGVIIVLMKLIGKESINPPFHLLADIGAQRILAG